VWVDVLMSGEAYKTSVLWFDTIGDHKYRLKLRWQVGRPAAVISFQVQLAENAWKVLFNHTEDKA